MDAKDSLKNIAKAGVCTSLAGVTALSGAGNAFADVVKAKELPMVREAENSGSPNSVDEARIMWELASSHADDAADAAVEAEQAARDAESASAAAKAKHEQAIADAAIAKDSRDNVFSQLAVGAQNGVDEQNKKVEAAAEELERAESDLAEAQEAHAQAQALRDSALSRYEQAQIDIAQLGDKPADTIVEDAQQAAKDAEAKRAEAYDKLVQAEADALTAKNNVQDAQDAKDVSASALASAKVELDNATTAFESAKAELDAADSEERVAELESEVTKAKNIKDSADLRVITERQTYEDLSKRLDSYKEDLAEAQAEVNRLKAIIDSTDEDLMFKIDEANAIAEVNKPAYDEKKAIVDEAQAQLDAAKKELADREAELEEAKNMLTDAESQVNAAQEALLRALEDSVANNKDVTSASLADFLEANGQSGDTDALELLNAVMDPEDIGKEGDATDWVNTQSALTLLSFLEDLRSRETGNITPFLVSSVQMSNAAIKANELYATDGGWKFDDGVVQEPNYDEFGNEIPAISPYIRPEDQFTMQYAGGLDAWNRMRDDGVWREESLSGDWENLSPDELKAIAPNFFAEVELYWLLNKATSDYRIGLGVNTANGNSIVGLVYEKGNENDHSTGMFIDDWAEMYNQWLDAKLQSDDVLEARHQLNVAQNYLLNSAAMTGSLQAQVDELTRALTPLQDVLSKADAEFALVKDAYEDRLTDVKIFTGQIDENIEAREQARIDIVEAEAEASRAENLVIGLEGTLEVQQAAMQRAASDATRAKYEYEDLQKQYEKSSKTRAKALKKVERETKALEKASQAYKDAQSVDEKAGEELDTRKKEQASADAEHELAISAHALASDAEQSAKAAIETARQYKEDWHNADEERSAAQNAWEQAQSDAATALTAYTDALGKQNQAEKAKLDADDALKEALSLYGRATAAEAAAAMGIMISDPEFADLSDYVEAANKAQDDIVKAKEALDAAVEAEKDANAAAETANEKWHTAIAIAAQAKVEYDNILALEAQKPPVVLPDTPVDVPGDNGDDNGDDANGDNDDNSGGGVDVGDEGDEGNGGNAGVDADDANGNNEQGGGDNAQTRPNTPADDVDGGPGSDDADASDNASSATVNGELVFASAGDVRSTTFVVNPDGSGAVVPNVDADAAQADDADGAAEETFIADDETPMDSMNFASDSDEDKTAGALGGGLLAAIGAAIVGTSVKPKNRRKVYEQGNHAVIEGDDEDEG